jgi:hypothetical protein
LAVQPIAFLRLEMSSSYIVPGKAPPSRTMFWPVMKPDFELHSHAHA